MRKITVVLNDETEEKFQFILTCRGRRLKWQRLPTYKEIMIDAMELLYQKEKELNGKD